jgi:magnesium-transporting ATPase (P-type)
MSPATDVAPATSDPQPWHASPGAWVLQSLGSTDTGLTSTQAAGRLAQHGPNRIEQTAPTRVWMRVLRQFNNLLIYVLLAAALVTFWLRDYLDAAVILGVVVINAVIGFVQEGKAERALEAVRALLASRATVLRGGDRHEIDAADLVPGDVVLLESGARVPADLRLLRTKNRWATACAWPLPAPRWRWGRPAAWWWPPRARPRSAGSVRWWPT